MKVIQIRGTHSCVKTSILNQFIKKYNLKPKTITIGKIKVPIATNNNYIAIAKQKKDGTFNGLDGTFSNANVIKHILNEILKEYKPKVLLFEGVMYGYTYQFTYEVNNICKANGYQYYGVTLWLNFNQLLERLYKRNSNKPINLKHLTRQYKATARNHTKLEKAGVNMLLVNTGVLSKKDMLEKSIGGILCKN